MKTVLGQLLTNVCCMSLLSVESLLRKRGNKRDSNGGIPYSHIYSSISTFFALSPFSPCIYLSIFYCTHTTLSFAYHTQYFSPVILGEGVHNQNTIVGVPTVVPAYQCTNSPQEFNAASLNSKS